MASSDTFLQDAARGTPPLDHNDDEEAAASPVLSRTRRVPYVRGGRRGGTHIGESGTRVKDAKRAAAAVDQSDCLRRALRWMFPRAGGVPTVVFWATRKAYPHRAFPSSSVPLGVSPGAKAAAGKRGSPMRGPLVNGLAPGTAVDVAAVRDPPLTVAAASSPEPLLPQWPTTAESGDDPDLSPRALTQDFYEEPLSREDPGDACTEARATAMAAMNDGDDDPGMMRAVTPDRSELDEPSDVDTTHQTAATRMKEYFLAVQRERQAAVSHRPPRATRGVLN